MASPFLVESRRGTTVHRYAVLVSMANLQIFESSNPIYYYLCRAILLAQLFWRNKVAAKFMCLNEKETL